MIDDRQRLIVRGILCGLFFATAGSIQAIFSDGHALPVEIPIQSDSDDGIEQNDATWHPWGTDLNLGRTSESTVFDLGLRFHVPELIAADSVLFARLRFAGNGGLVEDVLTYDLSGALEINSLPMWQGRRPSQLPRTKATVSAVALQAWNGIPILPVYYYSPNIASILNEIIAQPGWPESTPALILCLDCTLPKWAHPNFVGSKAHSSDYRSVTLEVCRTIEETFTCHEMLGRPTDRSITIHFSALIDLDVYVEYGSKGLVQATKPIGTTGGEPTEIVLDDLSPATCYEYRLRYRGLGSTADYETGETYRFHTQRDQGQGFTFTVQSDSHLSDPMQFPNLWGRQIELYETALSNVAMDQPDFHVSLGDFALTRNCISADHARQGYAFQQRFLSRQLSSCPLYFVIGNHEGELGWDRDAGALSPGWAEQARREAIPNPYPDDFYSGCPDPPLMGTGYRESYYAWEWGDALFVVLDPFWYTTSCPYDEEELDIPPEEWAWTLGYDQYCWLHDVLANSDRPWKIVLAHHFTTGAISCGGVYGRGGIEVSEFTLAERPTFEWGGQDDVGTLLFEDRRPGWEHGPVHPMLVEAGVDLVLHGHDHFFAFQQLDGIAYVLCPQPSDPNYGPGFPAHGGYTYGVFMPCSGHLRIRVEPDDVIVEYIRAYLPGDGVNGEVAFSRSLVAMADQASSIPLSELKWVIASPAREVLHVRIAGRRYGEEAGSPVLSLFDAGGRLCNRLYPVPTGSTCFELRDLRGNPLPAGRYFCRLQSGGQASVQPLLVLR